jgi:ribosomal protein S18 acetylase RimI-like enzyme
MEQIEIKRVEIDEVDKVVKLFDDYRIFYRQESNLTGAREFLTNRLKNNESIILLASIDRQPAGFTQLYPLFSSVRMIRTYRLNDLYVGKSFRKMGIASALMKKAQQLTREEGRGSLTLETEKTNLEGNSLYPKLGFIMDKDHNFYDWRP